MVQKEGNCAHCILWIPTVENGINIQFVFFLCKPLQVCNLFLAVFFRSEPCSLHEICTQFTFLFAVQKELSVLRFGFASIGSGWRSRPCHVLGLAALTRLKQ